MRIDRVLHARGMSGFYTDDLEAIRQGAHQDGFVYRGAPTTPGFDMVRQPGESVSVILLLDDGQIAFGDCAVAQYGGVASRERLPRAHELIAIVEQVVRPRYEGTELDTFRSEAEAFDRLIVGGSRLPAAIRYGVTQALLDASAKARGVTMAEVILDEYTIEAVLAPVPIMVQSGDDRHLNVDKMILKRADIIPHGLVNSIEKMGRNGDRFLEYAEWVRDRVLDIGSADYRPLLRFDTYGCIGRTFDEDLDRVTDYLVEVEQRCRPLDVLMEMPIDLGDKQRQLRGMTGLMARLDERRATTKLIVDEYCNTLEDIREWVAARAAHIVHVKTIDLGGINNIVEAVLHCRKHGVLAYQGGTCNETDKSAQVCVHLAVATQPFAMLAKPGMGVDEGLMIVHNEQQRLLSILGSRGPAAEDARP